MRSTRLRTTNYLAMLLALCLPACVQAATEAELCARDLEDIAQFMPVNDAGASDALARRGAAINDALLKARGEMPQVSDRAGCDASIYHYLRAWRRGHLWSQPRDNSTAPGGPTGLCARSDAAGVEQADHCVDAAEFSIRDSSRAEGAADEGARRLGRTSELDYRRAPQ